MTTATQTILVVDSNPETRTALVGQLSAAGRTVLEAPDGRTALEIVRKQKVRLVVSELYLPTGESECLIQGMRQDRIRGTRTLVHTKHGTALDRDWAKRWGATAFLIQPAANERLQYVVKRLLATPKTVTTTRIAIARRESLDRALAEIEGGDRHGTLAIIFGRPWWDDLPEAERSSYRKRAKRAGVTLRSDAMMSRQFVELRGGGAERTAPASHSPYRGQGS